MNPPVLAHDGRALDDVAQFADIARPVVLEQRVHRLGRHLQAMMRCLIELAKKAGHERRNVLTPLP
jgi:hypothetical protein